MRISVFDPWSGRFMMDWPPDAFDVVNYHVSERWPVSAQLKGARTETVKDGSGKTRSLWETARVRGWGCLVLIDAREGVEDGRGKVPIPFLGRVKTRSRSSTGSDVSMKLVGPASWLGRASLSARMPTKAPASKVMAKALQTTPTFPRLTMGKASAGREGFEDLDADTLAGLAESLADERGEHFSVTPLGGGTDCRLDWWGTSAGRNLTRGNLVLRDSVDVEWDAESDDDRSLEEMTVVLASFDMGNDVRALSVRAPGGPVLGAGPAERAKLQEASQREVIGQKAIHLAPHIPSQESGRMLAESLLRQNMSPIDVVQLRFVNPDLWGRFIPCDLVPLDLADPCGDFAGRVVGRLGEMTWKLRPYLDWRADAVLYEPGAPHA